MEQFTKTTGCETFAGLGAELATALDFAVITNKVFTMKVLAETQVTDVTLRIERLPFPDTEPSQDRVASITEVGVWQELTFDFSDVTTGTFKSMIIYFERNAECDGDIYYFDDIIQGDGGGTGGTCTAETVQSLGGADFNLTFQTDPGSAIVADGAAYTFIDNPDASGINTSCKVGEIVRDAALPFANNQIEVDSKFDFNANAGFKLKVWAPAVGTNVLLKLEDKTDSGINTEVGAVTTTANAWEELTFDFDASASGTYDKIVLFFDINTDSGATYYIDDLMLYSGGGTCTAETEQSLDATDFNLTFQTDPGVTIVGDGAAYSFIDNPDTSGINPSCKVAEIVRDASLPFANNQILFDSKFDFNANSGFKLKVWAPAVGTNVLLKLEDKTDSGINTEVGAVTTTANAWEELTFDFGASASGTYDKIVLFFDINTDSGATYYFDDFALYGTGSGGGGTAATFPLDFEDGVLFFNAFEGATVAVIDNPQPTGNSSSKVLELGKPAGVPFYAGINSDPALNGPSIDLANGLAFNVKIWSPKAGINVRMRLEQEPGVTDPPAYEIFQTVANANEWVTVTFDFSTTAATSSDVYTRLVLNTDWDTDPAGGETYYIDDIVQETATGGGGPIAPTAGPSAPTQDAADVISIFSDSYTDVPNAGFNNYGAAAFEQVDLGGNAALKYTFVAGAGGNFQVIELGGGNQIDAAAAGMTNFRFDLWFPNEVDGSSAFLMKVVDIPGSGATEGAINIGASSTPAMAQGSWLSFDIPITELQSNGLGAYSNIQQVVIDMVNAGEVYIDNLYFYKPAGGGGPIAPTAGPSAPTQDAADVISIFSDSYTDVPNAGFNNYGAAAFEQVDLGGNAALKYTFVAGAGGNFQVIELGGGNQIDAAAAGMTNFRFDLWFPNEVDGSSAFLMKVVDIPGSGATEGAINIGASSTPAMAQGSWLSFDIPITELQSNGLGAYSNIQQVVIDMVNAGEVYIDNLYFYKPAGGGGPIAPTAGPSAPTQDAADVISIFSDSYTDVPNAGFNNYGAAAFEQVDLGGNAALKYTFVAGAGGNFQVIELGGGNQIDAAAAGMTNFRFDLWFPNEVDGSSAFLMKVVDIPGSGATEGAINIGASSTPAMAQGSWLSFDIPITELQSNGLGAYSNIQQVVIDMVNAGEVYIDNLYFYKPAAAGGNLAINGDFETGDLTGWTSFATENNGTFDISTAQANGGIYSGLIVADVDGIGSPSFPVVKQANIGVGTVTPNTSVTITFDLYGSVAGAGGVVFAEFFSELSGGGVSKSEILGGGPLFPNGTWTTYSFTTTTGNDVSGGVTLQLKADCGGNSGCSIDAYFDNVTVTID